jgi:hypothetical protein
MSKMDEETREKLRDLSSELADVDTVILLLLKTKDDYGKLNKYIKLKRDLEAQIRDLRER